MKPPKAELEDILEGKTSTGVVRARVLMEIRHDGKWKPLEGLEKDLKVREPGTLWLIWGRVKQVLGEEG